jgi:hypothetical protein
MGTLARDLYSDGKTTFQYLARDTFTFASAVANVARDPVVMLENCRILLTCKSVTTDAKIQYTRDNASMIRAGIATWTDATVSTGVAGTVVKTATLYSSQGVTAVRLYITSCPAAGGANLYGICLPDTSFGKAGMVFTPLGGTAYTTINKTGADSIYGTIVEQSDTVDQAVKAATTNSELPMGVMFSAGIPDAGLCLFVESGLTECLLTDATAGVLGQIILTSATVAGRGTSTASPGHAAAHWREVGHVMKAVAQGVSVLCLIEVQKT